MQLTDSEELKKMAEEVETERKRLQGWAGKFEGSKKSNFQHAARCLGKIRENLKELALFYEQ